MREHRTWRRLARAILTALLGLALGAGLWGCGDGGVDSRQAQEQGSGQLAAAAAQEELSFSARVEYGRLEADLRLVRREGDWEVQVVNPEALRDMAFWFHQDRLTVRYKGLSFDLDPDSLPVQSAVGLLVSSLEQALAQQGLDFAYDEGRILVTGEGGFQLALDPASGEMLTLTVPEMDFSAQFSYP